MHFAPHPHTISRPVDWPSPYSRAGRFLGWVHFVRVALFAWACVVLSWTCYGVGILAGLCVVVAFLAVLAPIGALLLLGWLLNRLARWFASC